VKFGGVAEWLPSCAYALDADVGLRRISLSKRALANPMWQGAAGFFI